MKRDHKYLQNFSKISEKVNMPAESRCRIEDVIKIIFKKYFRMK